MKTLIIDCPDCLQNIDLSDKNSVIACIVTLGVAAIIRAIEKRKNRKK
jgi:hypothetical protein